MPLDGFLELKRGGSPAVEGECRDAKFAIKKAMSINSFEFGADLGAPSKKKAGEEGDKGSSSTKEEQPKKAKNSMAFTFRVTKDVDSATPQFFRAYCEHSAATAEPFDLAVITLRKSGGKEPQIYLVMEFADVFVSSFSVSSNKDELPEETVGFTFKKYVKFRYQPQTQHGHGAANIKGWSTARGEPL